MDGGNRPATARARQLAVRRFTAWLTEEGELHADTFPGDGRDQWLGGGDRNTATDNGAASRL